MKMSAELMEKLGRMSYYSMIRTSVCTEIDALQAGKDACKRSIENPMKPQTADEAAQSIRFSPFFNSVLNCDKFKDMELSEIKAILRARFVEGWNIYRDSTEGRSLRFGV
jgi:hypothetical protein